MSDSRNVQGSVLLYGHFRACPRPSDGQEGNQRKSDDKLNSHVSPNHVAEERSLNNFLPEVEQSAMSRWALAPVQMTQTGTSALRLIGKLRKQAHPNSTST